MSLHAACSPSSASMWLNCAASITKAPDTVRPSSKYAREGTAAHAVAEMVLKGDIFLPDRVQVEGEEFVVSVSMARALNPYINHVQHLTKNSQRHVTEQRVVVPDTNQKVWGTVDSGVWERGGGIHVTDLKFGKGVAVEPDAPQLKLYGLGLAGLWKIESLAMPVTLTVCQPRIGTGVLKSYTTTLNDLVDWRNQVVKPAIGRIVSEDTTEVAGAWCRWCVRKTECAAFNNRHQTHAASAFDDGALA